MRKSQCKSVWEYAVEHKGSREEWVMAQAVEDLETVGLRNDRVVLKSDQETSVVSVLKEIARQREAEFGTAIEDASVGSPTPTPPWSGQSETLKGRPAQCEQLLRRD